MASDALSSDTLGAQPEKISVAELGNWQQLIKPLASLKLTVALFALSIFIVLVGTLAQVDKDMWAVIDDYFRSWVAWINFQVFLPRSWFPNHQNVPGGFWFPGGAAIGFGLVINLLAAHLTRFKIQARGARFWIGLVVIALGMAVTYVVIASGHDHHGIQGNAPVAWSILWSVIKFALAGVSIACAVAVFAVRPDDPARRIEQMMLIGLAAMFGLSSIYLFVAGQDAYLGDSGMRILWQLIQGTIAGLTLLIGCVLVFRKRGPIALLHGGVGLLMFGQFYVAKYDVEAQITMNEGQTVGYASDVRQTELAIVDSADARADDVVVVPRSLLLASERGVAPGWRSSAHMGKTGVIQHDDLPFHVKVVEYYENSRLVDVKSDDDNLATQGIGLQFAAEPIRSRGGADSGGGVDMASVYVQFLEKDGAKELGTYMLSQFASAQDITDQVEVGGKSYDVALRFKRDYKPYSVTLLDVRKDDYMGTNTPQNYSSDVRVVDAERGVEFQSHIWMNNPLRYAGETFYQSGYAGPPDVSVERTTLQVVTNSGWMIPYVACMLVAVAMLAHFWAVLMRFLRRRARDQFTYWTFMPTPKGDVSETSGVMVAQLARGRTLSLPQVVGNAALVLFFVALLFVLAGSFLPPRTVDDAPDIHGFGKLPLVADGRVKPFDTLARNTLRVISDRETFKDSKGKRQPAIRWLLDVIADPQQAEKHKVFRILNLEVLDTLDLRRRKGSRYSVAEIRRGVDEFEQQVAQARQKDVSKLTVYERKLLELDQRVRAYTRVAAAFQPADLPPLPNVDDDGAARKRKLEMFQLAFGRFARSMESIRPPLAVPVRAREQDETWEWQSYGRAWTEAYVSARLLGEEPDAAVGHLEAMFVAYHDQDVKTFNRRLEDYQELLSQERPQQLTSKRTLASGLIDGAFGSFYGFEAYFNHVSPFVTCIALYVLAFILAALAWLGWSGPLNRAAFLLLAVTFTLHTVALAARVYISGRPPVTNLYSSAVFIGWGVVGLALIFELMYRNGIGNAVSAVLGFGSLLTAYQLAADGDTFTVLQAVLDTQFWLATHVVSITLGYATTFLAGAIGALYILRGVGTPTLRAHTRKELTRMIYGTVCFSIFFSFVGTVLGGLWADDSWGRFWGWDPKENGALMIVLWNALVLHARWGGIVKDRGLAVLAVGGNIVTAWSWFGVNELGVGLHSYGFTEGVLRTLGLFVLSQMIVIGIGIIPISLWWSHSAERRTLEAKD